MNKWPIKNFKSLKDKFSQAENLTENLSLLFSKFLTEDIISKVDNKTDFFEKIYNYDLKNIRNFALIERFDEQIESLKSFGYEEIFNQEVVTKSRIVVGLGSVHVLEASLILHNIYGIPYIPASELKGVCRSVAFWKLVQQKGIKNIKVEEDKKDKKDQEKTEFEKFQKDFYDNGSTNKDKLNKDELRYQLLFGSQETKGLLMFLDAFPKLEKYNTEILDLDIMNVHYQSFYSDNSGNTPAGDWENPNPIKFVTIKPGIKFRFGVLIDKFRLEELSQNEDYKKIGVDFNFKNIKNDVKNLITEAFEEFGVGAKTRLGYGLFKNPTN